MRVINTKLIKFHIKPPAPNPFTVSPCDRRLASCDLTASVWCGRVYVGYRRTLPWRVDARPGIYIRYENCGEGKEILWTRSNEYIVQNR